MVEERAIVKQCGYPVCKNTLTSVPKQKYHISMKTNKVYDITDRKVNIVSPLHFVQIRLYASLQVTIKPVWFATIPYTIPAFYGYLPDTCSTRSDITYNLEVGQSVNEYS